MIVPSGVGQCAGFTAWRWPAVVGESGASALKSQLSGFV